MLIASNFSLAISPRKVIVDSLVRSVNSSNYSNSSESVLFKISALSSDLDSVKSIENANIYLKLAQLYFQLNDHYSVISNAGKAISLFTELGDNVGLLGSKIILARSHFKNKTQSQIKAEFNQLLKASKNIENDSCLLQVYGALSKYYFCSKVEDSAMLYFIKFQGLQKKSPKYSNLNLMAELFLFQKKYYAAKGVYLLIGQQAISDKDDVGLFHSYIGLAKCYNYLEINDSAFLKLRDAIQIAQRNKLDYLRVKAYLLNANYFKAIANFEKSLFFYEKYNGLLDSLHYMEREKNIIKVIDDLNLAESKRQTAVLKSENNQKNILIYLLIGFLFLVSTTGFYMQVLIKKNRRLSNDLLMNNEELEVNAGLLAVKVDEQDRLNKEIEAVHLAYKSQMGVKDNIDIKLKEKSKSLMESLFYARNIQHALLPPMKNINSRFSDSFVLWLPREVVSGDFYWFKEIDDYYYLALGDCTGHGVPGAFMSMLGISYLNEISSMFGAISTGKMLDILNEKVLKSLNQDGAQKVLRDGMDISLVKINKDTGKALFSGAYNNAYIVQQNDNGIKIIDLKADRRPIGLFGKYDTTFSELEFSLQKGAKLYLASDGYTDQFGGERHKKFMKKRFRTYLENIYDYPMYYQKIFLNEKIMSWKGNSDQLDDILVIGIEL